MTVGDFLKQQNILVKPDDYWVCHDLKNNIRTADIKKLLIDYHESQVKTLNKSAVIKQFARLAKTNMMKRIVMDIVAQLAYRKMEGKLFYNGSQDLRM